MSLSVGSLLFVIWSLRFTVKICLEFLASCWPSVLLTRCFLLQSYVKFGCPKGREWDLLQETYGHPGVGVSSDSAVDLSRPVTLTQFVRIPDHILSGRQCTFLMRWFLLFSLSAFKVWLLVFCLFGWFGLGFFLFVCFCLNLFCVFNDPRIDINWAQNGLRVALKRETRGCWLISAQHEPAACPCSQLYPGLHQKWCDQQVERLMLNLLKIKRSNFTWL